MIDGALHLSPSLLSADYGALRDQALAATDAGGDSIHIDIMDGHYVHNLSFGLDLIPALKPHVRVPVVAHLEIAHPDSWINEVAEAGADMIVVQEDTCPNLPYTVSAIRKTGVAAGVGINPDGTFRRIEAHPHILAEIDLLIVMGVYPGFGGQLFAATTVSNILKAARLREETNTHFAIAVDGGVNAATVPDIVAAGARYLIAGSSVFSGDIATNMERLRAAARGEPD
ncbi:MAG: ribulose-phosphate 3-epimerase [Spirochaetales bacterium]|nr:ribulose-phosphate 3-epimerase [Spirochaetales bacterium]